MATSKSKTPSFIPQRDKDKRSKNAGEQVSMYYLMSLSAFFTCLVLLGALYGVNFWLEIYHIPELKEQVGEPDEAISDEFFERIVETDARVREGLEISEDQLGSSGLLALIGEFTAADIYYQDISFSGGPDQDAEISLAGIVDGFGPLVFQYDLLRKETEEEGSLISADISQMELEDQDTGEISFQLTAEMPFEKLSYWAIVDTEED